MKKFRDYLAKNNISDEELCLSNLDVSLIDVLGEGIKELEVSPKEYNYIIRRLLYLDCVKIPLNWRGKQFGE